MPEPNLSIARRDRRITGLRHMLEGLNVHALVFTLHFNRETTPRTVELRDWSGRDENGRPIDFQALPLEQVYVQDLCFLVRDYHELIIGRWVWWVREDFVQSATEPALIPIRRTT